MSLVRFKNILDEDIIKHFNKNSTIKYMYQDISSCKRHIHAYYFFNTNSCNVTMLCFENIIIKHNETLKQI